MDRNSVDWSGPMPALTTPFADDGRIDERALAANIDRLLAEGATGVVAGGCTGEFWALSKEERKTLMDLTVGIVAGRGTVIAGAGAVTVADTIDLVRHAGDAGCDGALVKPPCSSSSPDDEIFAHYEDVAAAVAVPLLLYNIPGNAVNALTPALVSRLADLDPVVGIKESSGDWNNYYATFIEVADRLRYSAARRRSSVFLRSGSVPTGPSIASRTCGCRAASTSTSPPNRAAATKPTACRRPGVA